MKDALLESILKMKPVDDETFFAFAIVIDDPDTPTWELRSSFFGPYEQTAALVASALGLMTEQGLPASGARVELYSGAKALAYLAESGKEEMRYQRERAGQAKN